MPDAFLGRCFRCPLRIATSRKIREYPRRVDARPRRGNGALAGWVTSGLSREQFGNHVLERDILDRDVGCGFGKSPNLKGE